MTIKEDVEGTGVNNGAEVTRESCSFSIVPKKVNVSFNEAKTVLKGNSVEDFLSTLTAADVTVTAESGTLKANENFQIGFSLDDNVVSIDAVGKIASDKGSISNAIIATVKNSNYELKDLVAGTLNVSTDYAMTLKAATAATQIAEAAANGNDYIVKISDASGLRTMKAKEWYAMVLPFDVTPAELVGALGSYVVVNTFKKAVLNADNYVNTYFQLEMDQITAGTPFVIKPAANVDWFGAEFKSKRISDEIAKVGDADTDKAFFYGTYEFGKTLQWNHDLDGSFVDGNKYQYLVDTDFAAHPVNEWVNPKNTAISLMPMEAYLILNSAEAVGARVFVEDIENGVTSIKSLSADQVNGLNVNAAEGWYNLNGAKAEGVPTQRGIYINNGKKIVIK